MGTPLSTLANRSPRFRICARLDIKGENLIKGIQYEGLRVLGDPVEFAQRYYREGADELLFIDAVASLYGRNQLTEIIESISKKLFIPLTVGGGIKDLETAESVFHAGADKVLLNTAVIESPELIEVVAAKYGSQAVILSIQAKKNGAGGWNALTHGGREWTNVDVVEWMNQAESLGAGEVCITSVDRDGTQLGLDLDLMRSVVSQTRVPVIFGGGVASMTDVKDIAESGFSAVAIGASLHYGKLKLPEIRGFGYQKGFITKEGTRSA